MFKVYLDPGHYGSTYNKSTTGLNYYESAMTWKLAGYLKTELENKGVLVKLSRTSINSNPSLYNRGYGAKGYDLFLSLHSNACGTESVDYPIVYRGYDKTEANEFAQQLSDLIHKTIGTKQAGKVATRKGTAGEYYGVLRGARAAKLTYYYIVEHSFHTNYNSTNWLMSDANLRKLAKTEAELICAYFVKEVNTTVDATNPSTIYRVRKSWKDSSSQIGAFSSVENAKKACKAGYYVFDENGNVIYPISNTSNSPSVKKDFIKKVQSAIGVVADGIVGNKTLAALVTISKTKNSKHKVVKPLQEYLNSSGYNTGNPDSIFGEKTHSAVVAYQKANGLTADGIVGTNTWKSLLK